MDKELLVKKIRMERIEFKTLSLDLKTPEGFWDAVVNYPYAVKKEKNFFYNNKINLEKWLDWEKMSKNIPNINQWHWLRGVGFLDNHRQKQNTQSYFNVPHSGVNFGYDLGLFTLYSMGFRRNPKKASLKMDGDTESAVISATVDQWKRLFSKAVKSGWDINTTDSDGRTLTHLVARAPDIEGFEWLFSMGASLIKKDYLGRSPLDELRKHYPDLATLWEFKPEIDKLRKAVYGEANNKNIAKQVFRF